MVLELRGLARRCNLGVGGADRMARARLARVSVCWLHLVRRNAGLGDGLTMSSSCQLDWGGTVRAWMTEVLRRRVNDVVPPISLRASCGDKRRGSRIESTLQEAGQRQAEVGRRPRRLAVIISMLLVRCAERAMLHGGLVHILSKVA